MYIEVKEGGDMGVVILEAVMMLSAWAAAASVVATAVGCAIAGGSHRRSDEFVFMLTSSGVERVSPLT